jgi:hypothetical protein
MPPADPDYEARVHLTVCELEVAAVKRGASKTCALGLQTLICLEGRPDTGET